MVSMKTRLTELLGIEHPIVQAPMAGSNGSGLAIAVSEAGGLGSLPCATLLTEQVVAEVAAIRAATSHPFNVNFFCHQPPVPDPDRLAAWFERLAPYYTELGIEPPADPQLGGRGSFDDTAAYLVDELRPPVVSFHFGLPSDDLVERVKRIGATVLSSATTVAEARWLVDHGCDVVIAQGLEAGGHRGMFLDDDPRRQVGTIALVPQVVDAIDVPVIAAGGIADGRGIAAALALGADGVQIGTAFLGCPDATTGPLHRSALATAAEDATALTNVITGRPARSIVNRLIVEVGPLNEHAPAFPHAVAGSASLRVVAEAAGSSDFSPLWAGQAVALARELPAGQLVERLVAETESTVQNARTAASPS
jgi:nitronate monooxygenase